MILRLFRNAGATGHVFFLSGGKVSDRGLAYSGIVGPLTTIAVVPTTVQIVNFAVEARTKDNQVITVTGDIKVVFTPAAAVSKFDFTMNPKGGAYVSNWEQALRTVLIAHVLAPIHEKAKALKVEEAIQAQRDFEVAVKNAVTAVGNPLVGNGITFQSASVAQVTANDDEVEGAIGSTERQAMLAAADAALHDRRLKAVGNDRTVKEFEAGTVLRLEEARAKLLEEQGKNEMTKAKTDAEATKTRLAPLNDVDPGKILGAALMEMAKTGRIGQLSIGPELLAALAAKAAGK